jgi:hypothetical protein
MVTNLLGKKVWFGSRKAKVGELNSGVGLLAAMSSTQYGLVFVVESIDGRLIECSCDEIRLVTPNGELINGAESPCLPSSRNADGGAGTEDK